MTTEAKHTPELIPIPDDVHEDVDAALAMAKRRDACFAACAGIPTEQLETESMTMLIEKVQHAFNQIGLNPGREALTMKLVGTILGDALAPFQEGNKSDD